MLVIDISYAITSNKYSIYLLKSLDFLQTINQIIHFIIMVLSTLHLIAEEILAI